MSVDVHKHNNPDIVIQLHFSQEGTLADLHRQYRTEAGLDETMAEGLLMLNVTNNRYLTASNSTKLVMLGLKCGEVATLAAVIPATVNLYHHHHTSEMVVSAKVSPFFTKICQVVDVYHEMDDSVKKEYLKTYLRLGNSAQLGSEINQNSTPSKIGFSCGSTLSIQVVLHPMGGGITSSGGGVRRSTYLEVAGEGGVEEEAMAT